MKQVLFAILSILFVGAFNQIQAQDVSANIHSNEIVIGDQVQLDITANGLSIESIQWPIFNDTLSKHVEILGEQTPDTILQNGSVSLTRKLLLTSFDSGLWAIPPIPVTVDGTVYETEAMLLSVQTVEVDTAAAIRGIKEPLDTPYTIQEILEIAGKIVGITWLVLAVLAVIAFLVGKSKKRAITVESKPNIAPHEWALQQLTELQESKLWQTGESKAYHIKLSDIIRTYLERRFNILALESTTHEIKVQLKNVVMPIELKEKIIEALSISDLAKFAKVEPLASENEFAITAAFRLVNETIPQPESEVEPENPEGENA